MSEYVGPHELMGLVTGLAHLATMGCHEICSIRTHWETVAKFGASNIVVRLRPAVSRLVPELIAGFERVTLTTIVRLLI